VELGKQTVSVEWPAFVGYCICTAGTVHIHGAHYSRIGTGDMNVFSSSADFLSREMQQLSELRYAWASVQHQRETLQGIYNAHSELVKSIAQSPMQYSPVFTLEDFFDRYSNIGGPGGESFSFDSANLSLADVVVDFTTDTYPGQGLYAPRLNPSDPGPSRPSLKRKNTAPSGRAKPELKSLLSLNMNPPPTPGLSAPPTANRPLFSPATLPPQPSPGMLHTPMSLTSPHGLAQPNRQTSLSHSSVTGTNDLAGFSLGNNNNTTTAANPPNDLPHGFPNLSTSAFNPSFSFTQQLPGSTATPTPSQQQQQQQQQQPFDPMFGDLPTNAFSTPTAWHGNGEEGANGTANANNNPAAAAAAAARGRPPGTTPNDTSPHESAATTGPGEEKDPFLSLLEQLAENESFMGAGNELDFFLGGAGAG
jgi:hypothetical protein